MKAIFLEKGTKDGFDLKAYKLLSKTGYDFMTHILFKSLRIFDERPELSLTQKKLKIEGYSIPSSRAELGYKSFEPFRIIRKWKAKVVDMFHITVGESNDSKEDKKSEGQRTSVFKR